MDSRIADRLGATLVELGVEVVFGLPGGAISPLFDALAEQHQVRLVIAKSEHGAITAASSYARYSGKVGVVLVTSGPGVLNALNGLASAQRESIPVVLFGGDVSRGVAGRNAVQDGSVHGLNIPAVARPLCAAVFDIARPGVADASVRRAFAIADGERKCAVYVNLPMDIGLAPDEPAVCVTAVSPAAPTATFDSAQVEKVASALAAANRPLFLAGNGARGHAAHRLVTLAESYGIPVVTSPKAKGTFPEDHPLSLGVYGHGGNRSAHDYVDGGVDVLVVLGSSLNDAVTHGWGAKLQAATLVQVDVDPLQVGRNYTAHFGFVGKASAFVEALLPLAPPQARKGVHGVVHDTDAGTVGAQEGVIAPQRAIHELQRILPRDAIFTCDIGEHLMFATHYLKLAQPDAWSVMTGHASMGTAVAAACGVKIAKPKRPVAALCGDGGFLMSLADVGLAAQEKLPIVIAVFNDFRYAMVELGHKKVYGRELKYPVSPLDVIKLAEGCGASARRIQSVSELQKLDVTRGTAAGPLVLDIHIDPTVTLERVDRFAAKKPNG